MFFPIPPRNESDDAPPASAVIESLDPQEEREYRAFLGPNADYYLRRWFANPDGRVSGTGFNRAAFFFSFWWLGYRKMIRIGMILYCVLLTETILELLLFVNVLQMPRPP